MSNTELAKVNIAVIKLQSEIQGKSLNDLEPYIVSLYRGGKSTVELGKMFGFSAEGIRRLLKRKKVRRRTQTETSTVHTLNHQYFKTVNTAQKAFWLGFIIRRGQIIKRTADSWYTMILVPESKLELLKRFRIDISCSKPIYKQKGRNRYVLSLVSTSWARHLLRLGWKEYRSGQRDTLVSHIQPELLEAFEEGVAASE